MKRAELESPLAAVGILILALLASLAAPHYWVYLGTSAVIAGLIALSVGVVFGRAGMMSLCPLGFAGLGAWTVGWLNLHQVPFLIAIVIGGLVVIPVGVLLGLPALRVRGVNLAVVTLTFGWVIALVVFNPGFPGADSFQTVSPPPPLDTTFGYFALCLTAFAGISLALWVISRRRLGRAWIAIRYSERAAAALGLSVPVAKLTAFAGSAFIAGVAGGLMAGQFGLLSGASFDVVPSIAMFALAVMFGAEYIEGALAAGAFSTFLPEGLRQSGLPQDVAPMIFGLGAIQALASGAGGVAGQVRAQLWARRQRREASQSQWHLRAAAEGSGTAVLSGRPRLGSDNGNAASPVLEIRNLSVRYGAIEALSQVNLRIFDREVAALIGPNGAGKSTLIDAVTGFVASYDGQILLDGHRIDALGVPQRAQVGIRRTFQVDRTIPSMTVDEYIRLCGPRLSPAELNNLLDFFGIDFRSRRLQEVDITGRRLVEVIGCLASHPKVILLDEPAASWSEAESRLLANQLVQIPERYGCAVLIVEHDLELVFSAAASVTVLDFGRLIGQGTPESIRQSADVMAAYLGTEVKSAAWS